MLIIISSIFISLIAWGIVSKEQLKGVLRASFIKICMYLFFGIIVLIIFYKTYQVGINTNHIYIDKTIGFVNEKGESLDSVEITIYHRLNPDNLRNLLEYDEHIRNGGVNVLFVPDYRNAQIEIDSMRLLLAFYQIHKYKKNEKIIPSSNYFQDVIKRYDTQLEMYRPKVRELLHTHEEYKERYPGHEYPDYTHEDSTLLKDALDYILEDCSHLLTVRYSTTKEQHIFPYESIQQAKTQWATDSNLNTIACIEETLMFDSISDQFYYNINGKKIHLDGDLLKDTKYHNNPIYIYPVSISKSHKWFDKGYFHAVSISNQKPTFNNINFFTASDMSQKIFETNIKSEIPIRSLEIVFDEPINISGIYPQPDIVTMRSVLYTDRKKLDYLQNHCLDFHAKLPTFENKQLVRSLVLTTVLVAIMSLFCANFYEYCINICRSFSRNRKLLKQKFSLKQECSRITSYVFKMKNVSTKKIYVTIVKILCTYILLRLLYLYIIYAYGNPLTIYSTSSFSDLYNILFSWP